jgi:ribose transport system ATP-binding protein
MPTALLDVGNVSVAYSGRRVLHDVCLEIQPGAIHGLIGTNGAGKSTLIKVLCGVVTPEPGAELKLSGQPYRFPITPGSDAWRRCRVVHQDLGLVNHATVLENIRIRDFPVRWGGRIHWSRERREVSEVLARFGVQVRPTALVEDLSVGEKVQIAIVRALAGIMHTSKSVLVLDEPTSSLSRDEVVSLFETLREVTGTGHGVLFVSHRLEEVIEIADRTTVIRDGRVVANIPMNGVTEATLVEHMLGFPLKRLYGGNETSDRKSGEALLQADNLSIGALNSLSFTLHRGEVIGLTGLLGTGWELVPGAIFGAHSSRRGQMRICGDAVALDTMSPHLAMQYGMAYLPGDRLGEGSFQAASVLTNVNATTVSRYFKMGRIRAGAELADTLRVLEEYRVVPNHPQVQFASLSGGNQQKALVAKWFLTSPQILLLVEPTQGVDVSARSEILARIRRAASDGQVGVLLASSELEDLVHLCDRVFVFGTSGTAVEVRGDALTEDYLLQLMLSSSRSESDGSGATVC